MMCGKIAVGEFKNMPTYKKPQGSRTKQKPKNAQACKSKTFIYGLNA